MMKKFFILTGLAVLSTSAFAKINNPDFINAQKINTQSKNSKQLAKGIRLSVSHSDLELEQISSDIDSANNKTDLDTNAQFSIGFSDIKIGSVGFMGEFSYLDIDTEGDSNTDVSNTRLSANATYGMNENIYVFGGLNISKYNVDSPEDDDFTTDYSAGIGGQIGVGAQVAKNLSLEVAYLSLKSSWSTEYSYTAYDEDTDTDYEETRKFEADLYTKGIQVNLVGTF